MKSLRLSAILSLMFFVFVASALGDSADKQYALVYSWSQEIKKALHDREILARTLSLKKASQLEIVANNQKYGVIYPLGGTLAEARTLALNQSDKLTAAGYTPAEIILQNKYTKIRPKVSAPKAPSPPQSVSKGKVTNDPLPCTIASTPETAKAQVVKLVPARIAKPARSRVALINSKVQQFLQEQRSTGKLLRYERAALVAYDLTNDTYLANINSFTSFQAASMIKPFVALAYFHQVKQGKLVYDSKSHRMMEQMIQQSNNNATNWFIRQLGGPARCNALINSNYRHLFRKVRICEYIPPGGKTYKNSALPQDYVQFLKALWHKRLPYSSEMLRVMSLPGRDRIFWGTQVPRGTQVYNKTGSTSYLCGDMGILVTKTKNGNSVPYAIVGIVQRSSAPKNYKQWMDHGGGVIREFSDLVYKEMKRKYNLQ